MLVEDEFLIRMMVSESLVDAGYEVLEAATGDEAVRILAGPVDFDLAVTDIQMPGAFDGNAVADAAKRRHPGLPVIYMTGNPISVRNAVQGTDALMRKPFAPSEVLAIVERLLQFKPAP